MGSFFFTFPTLLSNVYSMEPAGKNLKFYNFSNRRKNTYYVFTLP